MKGVFEKVKGSDIWWVRYADRAGRVRYEKGGTRGMAESLYHKRKTEVLQGKKLPESIRRKAVLFRELAEDAAEYIRTHLLTRDGKDCRAKLAIELFGDLPAASITPQIIDGGLSRVAREREWKPATFNRVKAFVSLAYRLALENGKCESNPARFVRRRRVDNAVTRWLTAEEEIRLREDITTYYPDELPAFDLALHTGMRRSEQYGLTWPCINFERRQIFVRRSKNGEARYIPLDNSALAALVTLRSRRDVDGPVMVLAKSGHGYEKGHALKTPKEWFKASCERSEVKDFTWHCLRHTFASRLVMAGVSLRKVQELMGHKTIAMTCRYAHLAPEYLQDAVSCLDNWGLRESVRKDIVSTFVTESKTELGTFAGPGKAPAKSNQVAVM
jgi:integrase